MAYEALFITEETTFSVDGFAGFAAKPFLGDIIVCIAGVSDAGCRGIQAV